MCVFIIIGAGNNYIGKSVLFEVPSDEVELSSWDDVKEVLVKLSQGKLTTVAEVNPALFRSLVKRLAVASQQQVNDMLEAIHRDPHFKNKHNARYDSIYEFPKIPSNRSKDICVVLVASSVHNVNQRCVGQIHYCLIYISLFVFSINNIQMY